MKASFALPFAFCSLALGGCSNTPPPPVEKVVSTSTVKGDGGALLSIQSYEQLKTDTHQPTDTSLRYITRGDTSKVVALKTLQFIVGLAAGGAQESGFTKDQLAGTPITIMPNPTLTYFSEAMKKSLEKDMAKLPAGEIKNPIEIRPYTWMLVYENLSGGDSYELHYQTAIRRTKTALEKGKEASASVSCYPEAVKAPLAQWQANNYQKVTEVTRGFMDACLKDFEAHKAEFLQ
ncbi:hypothetical protein ACOJCD_001592 [Cronobacter dublinensis]|uniref:hypothetical protein n=1 Tax=Cronobacter dublinensis TaxID=413497 RepID=UPI000CFA945A|nr:hypothetical protein [Cronobacter dublinensis]